VRLDALAVEEDVRREEVTAEQVVDDEGGDVALAAARVLGRPVVLRVSRIQSPGVANRLFQFRERERQR
jgi:hypothetical protein